VEIAGALFGVAFVVLTIRQSIWCWPIGLLNCAMYVIVFGQAKLYSDAVLQLIYVVMSLYGWYHWLYPSGKREELPVTRVGATEAGALVVFCLVGTALWGTAMHRLTDAAFPYLDTATMTASLAAQWLLTRKRLENWVVWIGADLVMIGIYIAKGLIATSILYVIFTVLAVSGLWSWWKELR
jgi:nicotinamide mononucleotide transporter